MSFSASDATAQIAAKAASRAAQSQAGRSQANDRAASGSFDDLLNSIPDAPPEPRAQSRADAPVERPQAPDRAAARPERTERPDRKAKADAPSDTKADDTAAAADDAASVDAAPTQTDKAVTEAKPAGDETTAKSTDETDTTEKPVETEAAETVTQAAVAALVPQAVVIDPATLAAAADPAAEGEKATKSGTAAATAALTAAAAKEAAPAASEQQSDALAAQTTGLSADDAEVLSQLAAKAQQAFSDAKGDKTAKTAATDKPAEAHKLTGEAAAPAVTSVQAPAPSGEADKSGAKPVQSDLMKVAAEHQAGKSDTDATPATDNAALTGNANAVAAKGPDTLPTPTFSAALHTAQATSATAAANGPAQASNDDKAVSMANVAVEVTAKISSGKNQFDIRLDPEELGRIHVKVNVDRDGNITTHMMADRPETLDLLRREVQGLERALQDAGLKTSDNGMQFSLRDQNANQQYRQDGQAQHIPVEDVDQVTATPITFMTRDYGRYSLRPSGVDIRV